MSYEELYEYCQTLPVPVSRSKIIPKVCELARRDRKPFIVLSGLNPAIVAGYIVWPGNSDHRFAKFGKGEPVIVVARELNYCWRRFVVVKEVMHYFDESLSKVYSADDFESLISDFHSPSPEHRSAAMHSEVAALWMALGVLCPEELRQDFQRKRILGEITDMEIATRLKMPLAYVSSLFHPDFKEHMQYLCDS